MPIDYETDIGKVRLLIPDTDEANQILGNSEITGFISIARNGNIKRAAALAIESIATSEALISKVIRTQDLQTDGAKLSDALLKRAEGLRKQAKEDDEDDASASFFDIIDYAPYRAGPELTED